jgi:hypothetical protein
LVGRGSFVAKVSARVGDPAGVHAMTLRYRSLDPGTPWHSEPMTPVEDGYEATVPLPASGLAYRLEVTDTWGNTAMIPDYRKETPYRVIAGR